MNLNGSESPPNRLISIGAEIAERFPDAATVFLSGSLIEGFGNPSSDLDIFVIHNRRPREDNQGSGVKVGDAVIEVDYHEELRIDVEHWILANVTKIAEILSRPEMGEFERVTGPTPQHFELANRIRIAYPVSGYDSFRSIHGAFDWQQISSRLCNIFVAAYDDSAEDAAGAIEADDAGTALLTSRLALGSAMDAYLAARGSTNRKAKWRCAKLRKLEELDILRNYLSYEMDTEANERAILDNAKSRLRHATSLIHMALEIRSVKEQVLP